MAKDLTIGNRNEFTKRFNFVRGDDGDVSFDDTEAHAVVTGIVEQRDSYWADPGLGSSLYTLRTLTPKTPSQAESIAEDGVQRLVDENRITDFSASARSDRQNGKLTLDFAWTTPTGAQVQQSTDL